MQTTRRRSTCVGRGHIDQAVAARLGEQVADIARDACQDLGIGRRLAGGGSTGAVILELELKDRELDRRRGGGSRRKRHQHCREDGQEAELGHQPFPFLQPRP